MCMYTLSDVNVSPNIWREHLWNLLCYAKSISHYVSSNLIASDTKILTKKTLNTDLEIFQFFFLQKLWHVIYEMKAKGILGIYFLKELKQVLAFLKSLFKINITSFHCVIILNIRTEQYWPSPSFSVVLKVHGFTSVFFLPFIQRRTTFATRKNRALPKEVYSYRNNLLCKFVPLARSYLKPVKGS